MGFAFNRGRGIQARPLMTPTGKVLLDGRGSKLNHRPWEHLAPRGFFVGAGPWDSQYVGLSSRTSASELFPSAGRAGL